MQHDPAFLRRLLGRFSAVPEEDWARGEAVSRVVALKKGEVFLRQGDPVNWLGVLERGLVRMFCNTGEREVNLGFELEGGTVGSYAAYVKRAASPCTLEALEDGLLLCWGRTEIEALAAAHHAWAMLFWRVLESELARKLEGELRVRTEPEERYAALVQARSPLLTRVPQHHLAAFLGIAPETLSRIRARLGSRAPSGS